MALVFLAGCGSSVRAQGDADSTDTTPDITVDLIPDPTTDPTWDAPTDPGVDTAPGSGTTGTACIEDDECTGVPGAARFCLDRIELGGGYGVNFPGGYCSAECTSPDDCGDGADCVDFGYLGLCFLRCTYEDECRMAEGYTCYEIPYVTTQTYCVPYF